MNQVETLCLFTRSKYCLYTSPWCLRTRDGQGSYPYPVALLPAVEAIDSVDWEQDPAPVDGRGKGRVTHLMYLLQSSSVFLWKVRDPNSRGRSHRGKGIWARTSNWAILFYVLWCSSCSRDRSKAATRNRSSYSLYGSIPSNNSCSGIITTPPAHAEAV